MTARRQLRASLATLLTATVAACSGSPLTLPPVTASLGPAEPAATPVSIPSATAPVEIYSRIARGALRCWFGPEGSLKKTHVFHGKADPAASGGAAEIAVHTREDGSSHGVLRAFAVAITPAGDGSLIEAQNVRFPAPQAALMLADVQRWTAGNDDCSVVGTGGWNAAPPAAATEAPKTAAATAKAESKGKGKAAPR